MRAIKRDERLKKTETPEQTAARHDREVEAMFARKRDERARAAAERRELERLAAIGRASAGDGRLLRINEVLRLTGIKSRTTLWRLEGAGQFPARVKLSGVNGRAVAWHEREIRRWIGERQASRTA